MICPDNSSSKRNGASAGRAARRQRALAAATAATLVVAAPRASADLAHVFDSTVTGNYDAATTWNPSTRFPIADAAPGTVTGDVAIVHGGSNIVTISSD